MPETYKPTEQMARNARRGLKMRSSQPKSNRGGTAVGLKRANQLSARTPLSLDTVKRMFSFFSRHEVDKQSASWKEGSSKGEQAWLMWGGDAGFTWSRKIVKSLEKKTVPNQLLVCMRQQVNASNIKRETRDDGEYIIISSATLPDNVVMNGGLYPADEIEKSYMTLERTLAPIGHPVNANGEYLPSIDPYAISNFHVGAHNENVRRDSGRVFLDKVIKVEDAETKEKGQRLLNAIEDIENGKQSNIHTSTGVYLEPEEIEGNNDQGQEYSWIARNMSFDHDAILLDEEGAATPAQGVGINVNKNRVMVVNVDLPHDSELSYNSDSTNAGDSDTKTPQGDQMKEMILKALAAAKVDTDGMSDEQMLNEYTKLKSKAKTNEAEAVANAAVAGFKELIEPLVADVEALKANAKADADAKAAELQSKVVSAGIVDEDTAKTMSNNQLSKLLANHKPVATDDTPAAFLASGALHGNSEGEQYGMVD